MSRKKIDEDIDKQNKSVLSREIQRSASAKKAAYELEDETRKTISESQKKRRELEEHIRDLETRYPSEKKASPLKTSPVVLYKRPVESQSISTKAETIYAAKNYSYDNRSNKTEHKFIEKTPDKNVKRKLDFIEERDNLVTEKKTYGNMSFSRRNENRDLASILKANIEHDRRVETMRNELALKSEFNLLDAFR
jgi:hypothetical protein